jgi:hypothetical protein
MSYSLLGPICVFKDVSVNNTKFFKMDASEYKNKPDKVEPKVQEGDNSNIKNLELKEVDNNI